MEQITSAVNWIVAHGPGIVAIVFSAFATARVVMKAFPNPKAESLLGKAQPVLSWIALHLPARFLVGVDLSAAEPLRPLSPTPGAATTPASTSTGGFASPRLVVGLAAVSLLTVAAFGGCSVVSGISSGLKDKVDDLVAQAGTQDPATLANGLWTLVAQAPTPSALRAYLLGWGGANPSPKFVAALDDLIAVYRTLTGAGHAIEDIASAIDKSVAAAPAK